MSERTAAEIGAYCEAASEGPWFIAKELTRNGVSVLSLEGGLPTASEIEGNREFIANARIDLPRVLEAAIGLREVVEDLLGYATEAGRPGRDRAAQIMLGETGWLVDSSENEEER